MSARDHAIELSEAADEPATSTSPSPPRRDLVGDTDDNFTRKRQRLDDGGALLRAVSNDSDSPSKTITSPHKEMVAMTIREHTPASPSPADGDEHDHIATATSTNQASTPTTSPAMMDGADDSAKSPPVIEIIDDDEDELAPSFMVQMNAEDHFRQFPYRAGFRNALEALHEITQHVQNNNPIPHDLLPLLTEWLQSLPDDPADHLQSFYISKNQFWIDFAHLVDALLRRRYQWMTTLNAGQVDDISRYPFGEQFGDDTTVDEAFSGFFSAYMRLCSHLLLIDVHLLNRQDHQPLPLLSDNHLPHLHMILRSEKSPLFHILRREYTIDVRDMSTRLHTEFLTADGAQNLLRFADETLHVVPMDIQTNITQYMCQILGTLGWTISQFPDARGGIDPAEYYRGILLFFRKYTEDLQDPAKILDASAAREQIIHFSHLLQEICQWDADNATNLENEFLGIHDGSSPSASLPAGTQAKVPPQNHRQHPDIIPVLVANTWKFNLLRKYVIKGKMELRVMSIVLMNSALVDLYKEYKEHRSMDPPNQHPVLQHLADILLRGRVVDYIISVDSHPQLISRSGNIAGFLVVTNRWMDSQADAIWGTVSHNPDPRVVTATMTMLRAIIDLMSPSDHLYLCMKIHDLPIRSFTMDILRFLRDLTIRLLDRRPPVDWTLRGDSARPWNVCVRLLQETAPRLGATKHELDLHAETDDQMRSLAPHIPEPDRRAISERCLVHITTESVSATGSVRAIFILASFGDATFLQQDGNTVRHVVEEIPSFVKRESEQQIYDCQLSALQYRLELLAYLVCRHGQLVPEDLYVRLWDHVVGPHALSNHARDEAWAQLLQATKLSPNNDFCQKLISTYVPTLDPQYYTSGLFDFVINYNFPITRKTIQVDGEDHSLLQIPGGDLLWSLALSSPKDTIETHAARELASRYIQIAQARDITIPDVEITHVRLVDQCMNELRSVFANLIGEPNERNYSNRDRFGRVLMFKKQMLELVRQKPEFNRVRRADSKVESMDNGLPAANAITIKYQFGNERQSLSIAPDCTVADLHRSLCYATGCSKINVFAGGQRLDLSKQAEQKIADTKLGGQLLVQAVQRDDTTQAMRTPVAGYSEFETNVVKHFDEMFGWLDADAPTSQLLFDFLTLFPYRSTITNTVAAGEATVDTLFPPGKFFQSRYATQALHSKLKEQSRGAILDENFLVNAIKLFDRALLSEKLFGDDVPVSSRLPLADVMVRVMLDFLRERPPSDVSAGYFIDAPALAARLMNILVATLHATEFTTLAQECYATTLEASLYSSAIWEAFWAHPENAYIHRTLLLTDRHNDLRESIKLKILSVCGGHLPSSCPLTTSDIASRYWHVIGPILPETTQNPATSIQLFDLAEHVFRSQDEYDRNEDTLRSFLRTWSSLLLAYNHSELPGRYEVDNVVLGFTRLLSSLVHSLKSYKRPLNAGALISSIYQKFLFTKRISCGETAAQEKTSLSVLDSNTRRQLYDLMLALTDDNHSYERLLRLSGDAQYETADNIIKSLTVDRAIEVRSRTGYVGLLNPRAICYMNSLLTQLFMNLSFREFMLGLEVRESESSQQLLLETQRLFATMQNSYRKAADPRPFAACVRTLDKTPIDLGVQMDADEFYNLLFDQWEAQLPSEQDKQRFRSFYGGQMLQQVKSKECEHVSERADSFFAVQCDVQGKSSLHESLQAFVQGDVMEGDNKYKCESCGGKFVDAVKRTCLKSAPDNLIFHLKRFDFDLTDFSRKKVHEYFSFPDAIDIGLYNVDHLSDPTTPHTEDPFDLVGVVVHFGSCENGHYYSYIRKRPCPTGDASPTWLNFNDQEVDPFDPAEIPQKAFGGVTDDGFTRNYKMYSAYMLFYQRRTAIVKDQERWSISTRVEPPSVEVPRLIQDDIDVKNDLFIREYCLFDPSHAAFVRQLHGASRKFNHGSCSENHEPEARALDIFLVQLSRVSWRQQCPDIFEEAIVHLRKCVLSCEMCCSITLQWFAHDADGLYNLLLRSTHPSVKAQTRTLLLDCLKYLREKNVVLYGTSGIESSSDMALDTSSVDLGVIAPIAKRLFAITAESYRNPKGWDDLYLTLTQIFAMGHVEKATLLDAGLLEFCLALFCMHARSRIADEYSAFNRVFKRQGYHNRLVGFVTTMLAHIDVNLPICDGSDRLAELEQEQTSFPLTADEKGLLLYWHAESKAFAVVDKMLEMFDQTKTELFYPGEVVKSMAASSDDQVQRKILTMIVQGITELNPPHCDAYLRVASSYCETIRAVNPLNRVCDAVVEAFVTSEQAPAENYGPDGRNVLRFFRDLLRLGHAQTPATDIYGCLINRSDKYASALLLTSEEVVRDGTRQFIRDLYSKYMEDPRRLGNAYACIRLTATDIIKRATYESRSGMPRRHLAPLLETGTFLLSLLLDLDTSEDPDLVDLKDENDKALILEWRAEVEPSVRHLPEINMPSPGEGIFDASDYGSESDDVELLDP